MAEIVLDGCRPTPLASYLKALGAFRLVSLRAPSTRAAWIDERMVLDTPLSPEDLVHYFVDEYQPSPILAPWNGGSGFHPKDNQSAFGPISKSSASRYQPLATTIAAAKNALALLGLEEKPSSDEKLRLLEACRSTFPDDALSWLDAAFVLTGDEARYPPLLGTGGNDGRLDFTNNYLQRLAMLFDPQSGEATASAESWLRGALFDEAVDGLSKDTMGQFEPAAVTSNPWDFVLMLEGALVFAAASTKRLGSQARGALAYPFTVRQTAAGYGSAALSDEGESRGEIWMPMWSSPARFAEIAAVFHEGRATVRGRQAVDGMDFARAASSLGVDRGIDAFERYGFQVRNGLAYFATYQGRFHTGERHEALMSSITANDWLDRFRRGARSKNAPSSVVSAAERLDQALFQMLEYGRTADVRAAFIALGRVERALVHSAAWTQDKYVRPVPWLVPDWVGTEGSVELRLAIALACLATRWGDGSTTALRHRLEPVEGPMGHYVKWRKNAHDVPAPSAHLEQALREMMHRHILDHDTRSPATGPGGTHWVDRVRRNAPLAQLGDVRAFVDETTDDEAMLDLLWSCALIDWRDVADPLGQARHRVPDASYALLKLCFAGRMVRDNAIPVVPQIARLASVGDDRAMHEAVRRLRGSGCPPLGVTGLARGRKLRRIAAALFIPLTTDALRELEDRTLSRTFTPKTPTDEVNHEL